MAVKKTVSKFVDLTIGAKGKDVTAAQKMLAKTGSTIKATGVFTIGMRSAVYAFQRKNGLPKTGIIDKKTWDMLVAKTNVVKRIATRKGAKKE